MKINIKVRLKNPIFWASIFSTVILTILTQLGLNFQDITTWQDFFDILLQAVKNPVIVVSVVTSVYNALIDPTTKGFGDSVQALSYKKPKGG